MSYKHNFLFLVSDHMAEYTMRELKDLDDVKTVNKDRVSKNKFKNLFFKAYLSISANRFFSLPFKSLFYRSLFKTNFKEDKNLCIVISPAWYDKQLIRFFRKCYPDCKLIIHFHDTVKKAFENNRHLSATIVAKDFDGAIAYNLPDAKKYGFIYRPVGYTPIPENEVKVLPKSDVVFVGAAKDRLPLIRKLYHRFTNAGLKCDFYVTEVPKEERFDDGIVYGDKSLPFPEYIAREVASDCLLEILQEGSTGRTYRMMEAIIYNKKLITNCPEIMDTQYYDKDFVLYFQDENEITADFVKKDVGAVDFNYDGEFSQKKFVDFIDGSF